MRRTLVMWCLLAVSACRSGGEPAPAKSEGAPPGAASAAQKEGTPAPSSPTTVTGQAPGTAPPPSSSPNAAAPAAGPSSPSSQPRPLAPPRATASGPSAPGASACQKDSDCALTMVPDGECCPRLCSPRAVTLAEARLVDERVHKCEQEHHPCFLPSCRARAFEPACVNGTCSARPADDR